MPIAMDDFGTGFSNLASLHSLPIDILKIDRSFVSNMLEDHDKAVIVRTILSLAESLNLRVTAEGIETQELADMLQKMGCWQVCRRPSPPRVCACALGLSVWAPVV